MSSRDRHVQQPVIVVIKNGQTAATAGLIQADFCGDVFKLDGGLFIANLHFHALAGWNEFGIATQFLRRKPEPVARALVVGIGDEGVAAHLGRLLQLSRPI